MNRKPRLLPALLLCLALAGCGGAARTTPTDTPAQTAGTQPTTAAQAATDQPAASAQAASAAPTAGQGGGLRLYFLNVGKGDAALLHLPGGGWAMVDTGPESGYAAVGGLLRLLGIKQLDAVFISHPHKDHRGGLDGVLGTVSCPVVYTTPADYGSDTKDLKKTADSHGVPLKTLAVGDRVALSGAVFTAVGPNGAFPEPNDNSLALLVEGGGRRALFVGDELFAAETALLKKGFDLRCDVLKVGHHGKADATGVDFLAAVRPRFAAVPTGVDPSVAPDAGVLARLQAAGADARIVGNAGGLYYDGPSDTMKPLPPQGASPALAVTAVDSKAEYVEVANRGGSAADLTGWSVLSDKGNQLYFFPQGYSLAAGKSVRVYSGTGSAPEGALFWTDKKIWHDKKADRASLVDPYGRAIATK